MKYFKWILLLVAWSIMALGADFANRLPVETKQLVESFDCFSKRDKMALYSYALALQYRMDHIKDRKALEHGDLDYWRLFGMVSDVANKCELDNLRSVIDGILTPTPDLKKLLKRLHWVESGLPQKDGWSESSKRMSAYDKKLLDSIMAHPPKWTFALKNPYLHDYNLTALKKVPKRALPKNAVTLIDIATNNNSKIKKTLTNLHWIYEQMVKFYDKPKVRLKLAQQKAWVDACLSRYQARGRGFIKWNFRRALASSLVLHNDYYPVRSDFLPKELDTYCEHNIINVHLASYALPKDKPVKRAQKSKKIRFDKTKALLKKFASSGASVKKYQEYLNLSLKMLDGNGKDLVGGLKLIRLRNCFQNEDKKRLKIFFNTLKEEAQREEIKSEFNNRVLRPQMWWFTTIGMLIKQNGETKELKYFFDCNATQMTLKPRKRVNVSKRAVESSRRASIYKITSQRDEILKYYVATFVGKPTSDMSNEKAIKSGIVEHKYLDKNGIKIKPIGEVRLKISGMPKGGIKLTYNNIVGEDSCRNMLMGMSFADTIHYNNKRYSGLDYVLIDGAKVKLGRYFNDRYVKRLCAKGKKHTISYVKERTVAKYKYASTPITSTGDRYIKKSTIDKLSYKPDGVAVSSSKHYFATSGEHYGVRSGLYDASIPAKIDTFPEPMDNAFKLAVSENGDRVIVIQGYQVTYWNAKDKSILRTIGQDNPLYKMFNLKHISLVSGALFSDNVLIGIDRQNIRLSFIDPLKSKEFLSIKPHIFIKEGKYRYGGPEIVSYAFSRDRKSLYIGTNRNTIEVWKLSRSLFGFGKLSAKFERKIVLDDMHKIAAMLVDSKDANKLYIVGNRDRIYLYDIAQNKIIKTYISDYYMQETDLVQVSDDGKYLLVTGFGRALVWKTGEPIQWDVFLGDDLKGATFRPNSNEIITIGRTIDVWRMR